MMAKKKMGWTAVYDLCPEVDGKVYPTRKAAIEAHGKSIVWIQDDGAGNGG